jgi:hypothetical protein
MFEQRAMGGAAARRDDLGDLVVVDMDGVREPHVVAQPAQRLHPVDRTELETLERVALLVQGLAEVGVQPDLVVPRHRRRLLQERRGHGKRRTGRQRDLRHRADRRIVILLDDALTVLENGGFILDAVIRRRAALRFAERHRPAAGVEAYPQLARRLDLAIDVVAVLVHVTVVEHRRADNASSAKPTSVLVWDASSSVRARTR